MYKIYTPKPSTCLWCMIGFFFVYRYIFGAMDFNDVVFSINNDDLLFTILLIMISHPFNLSILNIENKTISILHYLNIFMILYSILATILSIIYTQLILLIKEINDIIDYN